MNFHNTNNFDITLVASTKEITIPYGVCNTFKNGQLNNIEEKPTFDYLVNTGLYILKPELLKLIPKNKYFDMTDLINAAKKRKKKLVYSQSMKMNGSMLVNGKNMKRLNQD